MEYTTERGVTVNAVPIPLLLDAIRKAHPEPELPTYTEHLAGGAEREIPITREVAAAWEENDPATWAEYADTWADYLARYDAWQEDISEKTWRAVRLKSIRVELPTDDTWIREQESLGLTVPTDPMERRLHYIRTEAIGTVRDILKLTAIANGADMSEEALSLAEDSFRRDLARSLIGQIAGARRSVADQPAGGADPGGEGVG